MRWVWGCVGVCIGVGWKFKQGNEVTRLLHPVVGQVSKFPFFEKLSCKFQLFIISLFNVCQVFLDLIWSTVWI